MQRNMKTEAGVIFAQAWLPFKGGLGVQWGNWKLAQGLFMIIHELVRATKHMRNCHQVADSRRMLSQAVCRAHMVRLRFTTSEQTLLTKENTAAFPGPS